MRFLYEIRIELPVTWQYEDAHKFNVLKKFNFFYSKFFYIWTEYGNVGAIACKFLY